MFPPGGAAASKVTLCVSGPGKAHVTVPSTAIFTVSGVKLDPAPLAVTLAVRPRSSTDGVDVAVFVVPPELSDAVMVALPGLRAITRPAGETDTDVPLVRRNVAAGSPLMFAPF
jgi:hypothetical protein